jgi:hypothetical protein
VVPRVVFVINTRRWEGKDLGSGTGKTIRSGLFLWLYFRRKYLRMTFTAIWLSFDICFGKTAREDSGSL